MMVVVNWLTLLAVSEKLCLTGASYGSLILGEDNKKHHWGKNLHCTLNLWGKLYSLKIWWEVNFGGPTTLLTTMVRY